MNFKSIESEALHLPAEQRVRLAQTLLLSLESLSDVEIDRIWALEAERRAQELDDGHVMPVSAEEVSLKARALLR